MTNKYYNKEGKEIERQKCLIYARVMGYLSIVSNMNIGKKSEFYSRKYFEEKKSSNSKFMRKFS